MGGPMRKRCAPALKRLRQTATAVRGRGAKGRAAGVLGHDRLRVASAFVTVPFTLLRGGAGYGRYGGL